MAAVSSPVSAFCGCGVNALLIFNEGGNPLLIRMSDAFCASAVSHRRSSSGWKCAPISAGVSDRLCFFENTLEPFRPRCRAGYRYSSLASFRFKPCSLRRQVSTGRRTLLVRKGSRAGCCVPPRVFAPCFPAGMAGKRLCVRNSYFRCFARVCVRLPVRSALGAPAIAAIGPLSAYRSPARFAGRS